MKVNYLTLTFFISLLVFPILNGNAQVGIGNTSPSSDALLDVGTNTSTAGLRLPRVALTATNNASPLSAHVQGMTVYNTATNGTAYTAVTPGQYYNDGTKWIRVGPEETPIDSVALTSDQTITATSWTDMPGLATLSFVARKSSVLVLLTGSGLGYTNSMDIIQFRIQNITSGTSIGGTMNKIQSYDSNFISGTLSVTTWSLSFSKLLTGLTIGNTYQLKVQYQCAGAIVGSTGAAIYPTTNPDTNHLTLSVIQ